MTSKEALQDLRFNVSMSQDLNYKENNDLCDIIEKELKVLDILKRVINLTDENEMIFCGTITFKEYDLLKEVLKNDK